MSTVLEIVVLSSTALEWLVVDVVVVVMALVVVISLVGLLVVTIGRVAGLGFSVILISGAGCSGPKIPEILLEGDSGPRGIGNGEAFPETWEMSSTIGITLFILSISAVTVELILLFGEISLSSFSI